MKLSNPVRYIWVLGALLVFLPYLPLLANPRVGFLFRDLSNIMIPYKATWLAAVAELGRIPHWDPFHGAGFRFIADLSYGPLYPLNLLLFPLSATGGAARGLTLWIVFHHGLIYFGFYLFLRELRVRPSLAALGGLAVAWAGPAMSSDSLLHHVCSQAAVGFFFFFWRRTLRRPSISLDQFMASAALAWPIYGGDPQYSYGMGLVALLMLRDCRHSLRASACKLLSLIVLTVLAAAPQLFPTAHELATVGRELSFQSDAERMAWSLNPVRIGEIFFPLPFGPNPANIQTWAAGLWDNQTEPFLFSLYAGAVPGALALLHLFLQLRRPRWAHWFLAFVALVLLTLGHFSPLPLYEWAMNVMPFWRNFRYPERLGYWISLAIAVFGFLGAEKAMRLPRSAIRGSCFRAGIALGGMALLFGGWMLMHGGTAWSVAWGALLGGILLSSVGSAGLGRWRVTAVALLMVLDLAPVARQLVWAQPLDLLDPASYPWAQKILKDRNQQEQAFALGEANRFFSGVTSFLPGDERPAHGDLIPFVHSAWAGMKFNTPSLWGLPLVRSHSSLSPDRPVLRLTAESPEMAQRVLDLTSTRYLLVENSGSPIAVVRPSALPKVLFPPSVERFSNVPSLLGRMKEKEWNSRSSILLETDIAVSATEIPVTLLSIRRKWDRISLHFRNDAPSPDRWMLLNEAFDAQWRASLGGNPLKIVRANGWAMGLLLPKLEANHEWTIELEYFDYWYSYGLCALVSWILLLVFVVWLNRVDGARFNAGKASIVSRASPGSAKFTVQDEKFTKNYVKIQ